MSMEKKSVIISLDTILEYKDGQVYIKKMNTNQMPVNLTFSLIDSMNVNTVTINERL